jgi:hypothetical protein
MAEDPEESLACMRKVLSLNPKSRRAWQGFEWAAARLAKARGEEVELPDACPAEAAAPSVPAEESQWAAPGTLQGHEGPEPLPSTWRVQLTEQWVPIVGLGAVVGLALVFFVILKLLGG